MSDNTYREPSEPFGRTAPGIPKCPTCGAPRLTTKAGVSEYACQCKQEDSQGAEGAQTTRP